MGVAWCLCGKRLTTRTKVISKESVVKVHCVLTMHDILRHIMILSKDQVTRDKARNEARTH